MEPIDPVTAVRALLGLHPIDPAQPREPWPAGHERRLTVGYNEWSSPRMIRVCWREDAQFQVDQRHSASLTIHDSENYKIVEVEITGEDHALDLWELIVRRVAAEVLTTTMETMFSKRSS